MSQPYTRNLVKSLPATIGMLIVALILTYMSLPTNVGFTFWSLLILIGVCYYMVSTSEEGTRFNVALGVGIIGVILVGSMFFSPIVFTRIDNAKYFEDNLIYMDDDDIPFTNPINGTELRVVDKALAKSIMDRTNPFGSNREIVSIHLGNYQGNIYWIGAAVFDGPKITEANNRVVGFLLVDITDPTSVPIEITTDFELDPSLIFNHDTKRAVWFQNMNYLISDNYYFSYNDDLERMELIVPYSIRDSTFLGDPNGGFVTSDMELQGGILIFDNETNLVRDYGPDQLDEVPSHARIQVYSETWLENQIRWWGRSLYADNDVRWSTALPWVQSERRLGIDDDIRVVISPDSFEPVQYVLLDSTDSSNQILRGAIKANISGLHYYNLERFQYIDTNSAHDFVEQTITNIRQTSTHGYKALLPILYPVRDNVTSFRDYAYVMPLQLGDNRFGGIAITNPADKTGTQSIVEFVESEEKANVSATVARAIDRYLALVYDNNITEPIPSGQIAGNFSISEIRSYEKDGSTIYAMNGNFSEIDGDIRVLFTQDFITNEQEWLEVVFTDVGDTLNIIIEQIEGVFYAQEIIQ